MRVSTEARAAVASIKTYWNTLGEAINVCMELLETYGFALTQELFSFDAVRGEGRETIEIIDLAGDESGSMLVFGWYRMPSGRYEITAYVS